MVFGYDANVRSRNIMNIMGFAENLLAGLRTQRRRGVRLRLGPMLLPSAYNWHQDPTKPIIFVGHSMGGLIIKNVSQASSRLADYL